MLLGKRLNLDNGAQVEIVGVVGHVKQWGLDVDDNFSVRAELYLPSMQVPDGFLSGGASGNTHCGARRGRSSAVHGV